MKKQPYLFNFFGLVAVFLSVLPFIVTVNEGLARLLVATPVYKLIQNTIVPYEVKIVAAILQLLHIPNYYQPDGLNINGIFLQVTWNCLGWQSLFFLLISFFIGLQGSYTRTSIVQVVLIGVLGTFILNIFRISMVSILGAFTPVIFRVVYHDYLAAIITLIWLGGFWWFAYKYILDQA